jgi:hypothetical protein
MAMQKEGLKPQPSDYAPLHGAVVTETSTPVSAGPTQVPQEVHDIARIRQHLPNDKLMVQARVKDLADELVQTFNSNGKNAAGVILRLTQAINDAKDERGTSEDPIPNVMAPVARGARRAVNTGSIADSSRRVLCSDVVDSK